MGKILIGLVLSTLFLFQGCEAFKNYYDKSGLEGAGEERRDITESLSQPDQRVPGGSSAKIDYSVDKTKCDSDSSMTITLASAPDEMKNEGWTSDNGEGKVNAEKLALYTTKIMIANDAGKLSLTVKQVGEKDFHVCDVMFEGCDGECVGVKSLWTDLTKGSLEIYKHTGSDAEQTVNAGKYDFTFDKSSMGDAGITLSGSYFTETLEEAPKE